MKMTYLSWPSTNIQLSGELGDSHGKDSLTLFVGNHRATDWLGPYDLILPWVQGGMINNPLFSYTGLK